MVLCNAMLGPRIPQSKIQAKLLQDTGKNCSDSLANDFTDLQPSIPGEMSTRLKKVATKKRKNKNPPHIPQGMKQNDFLVRRWELGGLHAMSHEVDFLMH